MSLSTTSTAKRLDPRLKFVAIGAAVFLPLAIFAIKLRGDSQARIAIERNFEDVFLGLHNYQDVFRSMPTSAFVDQDGRERYSWRFAMFPYVTEGCGDFSIDGAWDADDSGTRSFREWNSWYQYPDRFWKRSPHAMMLALVGPGTAWNEGKINWHERKDDSILLIEHPSSGLNWMQPGDVQVDEFEQTIELIKASAIEKSLDGFRVMFADGELWRLSPAVPTADLALFKTLQSAQEHDREKLLGKYRLPNVRRVGEL